MKQLFALILMTGLISGPAMADGYYNGKAVDCYCTDKTGARVELGEMICLHVDGRSFMAQCQMSLNNPMWREVSEGCLSSSLPRSGLPRSLLPQSRQPTVQTGGVDAKI